MRKEALCFGVDDYPGTANDLKQCVKDMNRIADIADLCNYNVNTFVNYNATGENLEKYVKRLALELVSGDYLFIWYSGHGTQMVDWDGDEIDGYDEALFMYDGMFPDDKFRELLQLFKQGVHIFIGLDSCFSGTMTRGVDRVTNIFKTRRYHPNPIAPIGLPLRKKMLADEDMIELLMTGCSDTEYSYETLDGGAFTNAFRKAFIPGITWRALHEKVREDLPSILYRQTPQLEGRAINKDRIAFGLSETDPIDLPDPTPVNTPWYKSWYVYAGSLVVIGFIYAIYHWITK